MEELDCRYVRYRGRVLTHILFSNGVFKLRWKIYKTGVMLLGIKNAGPFLIGPLSMDSTFLLFGSASIYLVSTICHL